MDIFVFGGDINDNCDCWGAQRTANHFISKPDEAGEAGEADEADDDDANCGQEGRGRRVRIRCQLLRWLCLMKSDIFVDIVN